MLSIVNRACVGIILLFGNLINLESMDFMIARAP